MAAPLSLKTVRQRLSLFACIFLISLHGTCFAETVAEFSTGLSLTVDPSGQYTVRSLDPPFHFGGDIGTPLSDLVSGAGIDQIGLYREISFRYASNGARAASIRIYGEKPIVLFSVTYLEAAPNKARFPALTEYPSDLFHVTYEGIFGTYRFNRFAPDSPWVFLDANANTFILSPASNFSAATTVLGSAGEIQSGINQNIATVPQDLKYDTILVIEKGVNKAFDTWGRALTSLHGKTRPANDADLLLSRLGYWTDNGASYYYRWEADLGFSETLLRVKQEFDRQGVPLGYLQLDSWFYPKGARANWADTEGGIYRYSADTGLFPRGLKNFQQSLGIPLATHARWIDAVSPYRLEYKMSNNVATDPLYWNSIAGYLGASGVVTYEQDWLGAQAQTMMNLNDGREFFSNMAQALRDRQITIQYCMPLPAHYMQSARYDNVTTIRTSGDRFNRNRWDEFLFASRFASALGLWPWSDVFMSRETDNLLLSALSAGPVGVGDRISEIDGENLLRAVRADGVIVKPDEPIVPLDESFISDAQGRGRPMVAFTHTDFERTRALYIFAYRRGEDSSVSFTPAALGLHGPVFVYNYFTGAGVVVDGEVAFLDSLEGDRAYYIAAPIGLSGIGFLGDAGHFVSLGKKRIARLDDRGSVEATVNFAKGEVSRTLFGYSPSRPVVNTTQGAAVVQDYDADTHLFRVTVTPGSDGAAVLRIGRL
jgi:hypothetical protein